MKGEDRLVQLTTEESGRVVCLIDEPCLHVLSEYSTVYDLARAALAAGAPLGEFARAHISAASISYDAVGDDPGGGLRFLPAIDHPVEPARCLVSGTGLTHRRSVDTRQAMHATGTAVTDSERMYALGSASGRPEPGAVGVAPEWFYKGNGLSLRAHGQPLVRPVHAEDAGEEPELAGVYMIDRYGVPRRLGMAIGNEFSDHELERRNYLYLAPSKLRMCALGPELVLDPDFTDVRGEVAIERDGTVFWSCALHTGDAAMCHSLTNIEHHHFKNELHRRPGDVHVHFFGADAFSFSAGIALQDGDVMRVSFDGFGRPLRNRLVIERPPAALV
ncbi:MAG: AraD1 family protein, partial [Longimicrobiales bacterium]